MFWAYLACATMSAGFACVPFAALARVGSVKVKAQRLFRYPGAHPLLP
jgi:hypothetical protein